MAIFFRPGQQIRTFDVYRKDAVQNTKASNGREYGRVAYKERREVLCTVSGTLSKASPKQIEQWSQESHPVTHTLVVRGTCDVREEDVLVRHMGDCGYQPKEYEYHVHGVKNSSDLGIFTVIFCEQKEGIVK